MLTNEEFMGAVDDISSFQDLSNKDPGPKRCKKCKRLMKDIFVPDPNLPDTPLGDKANPNRWPRGELCPQCMHATDKPKKVKKEDITIRMNKFLLCERRSKDTWMPGREAFKERKYSSNDPYVNFKELYDRNKRKHLIELVSDSPFHQYGKEVDFYMDGKKMGSYKGLSKAEDEMWTKLGYADENSYQDVNF
jgi:hypothetical protein